MKKTKQNKALVWFKNDLRTANHHPLNDAVLYHDAVFCLYIINTAHDHQINISDKRVSFLFQHLSALQKEIRDKGGELFVFEGNPAGILKDFCAQHTIRHVYTYDEFAWYETLMLETVRETLEDASIELHISEGQTLIPESALMGGISSIPFMWSDFRKKQEHLCETSAAVPSPESIPYQGPRQQEVLQSIFRNVFGNLFCTTSGVFQESMENAGSRIRYYFREDGPCMHYHLTRNGMLHKDDSSRMSVWLSCGAISAVQVYQQLCRVFKNAEHESFIAYRNELLWRDFFCFSFKKNGKKYFLKNGIRKSGKTTVPDLNKLNAWKYSRTGVDLIDAIMHELLETGYITNRSRQIAASYLVNDLQQDWTEGAAWFEYHLLDYNPCLNWGNWAYIAGVGNDPRPNRYFNPTLQAEKYDPDFAYRNKWSAIQTQ
ncbi:MAG: DASH family cryptochrome [Bacteroidia bacterium]